MGLIRLLAGALLVLWLLRLVRRVISGATRRPASRRRGQARSADERSRRFKDEGVEEADYEELP